MKTVDWTDERISELKQLWESGVSGGVIAKKLGLTRNSIIGKVHRLGLKKRQSTCRIVHIPPRRKIIPARHTPSVSVQPLPPEPPAPATALRLTLMQLTDATCKCGLGDPKHADFAFCGLPVKPGSRYCPAHHARFYSTLRTENARKITKIRPPRQSSVDRFERWAA